MYTAPRFSLRTKLLIAAVLVAFGVLSRLLPHAWNMTPVTAIALFAGAYLGRRAAFLLPLAVLFISDAVIGFYAVPIMFAVYGSFALIGVMGSRWCVTGNFRLMLPASISSSLFFFFTTNWAVWQFGTMYAHDASGLLQSYMMALPFLRNMLAGDLFYTTVLFGSCAIALRLLNCRAVFRGVTFRRAV